ncbi:MAG: hypothetical protein P1P80_01290 [ANME-2 cluster archaeon]|nr:hypothetical protein [ANME-2 cluster archaeon]
MIERKEIQGTVVFIDHDNGEIHFSDTSNVIRLSSTGRLIHESENLFHESPFNAFGIPVTSLENDAGEHFSQEDTEHTPQYEADNVFYNAIDNSLIKNFMGSRFEDSEQFEMDASYDVVLASENAQMIADNIVNTIYAEVLMYLTPKKLIDKSHILENIECTQDMLDDLLTHGFLKENYKGELYFTFKGLLVRRGLEKTCCIENIHTLAQPTMA